MARISLSWVLLALAAATSTAAGVESAASVPSPHIARSPLSEVGVKRNTRIGVAGAHSSSPKRARRAHGAKRGTRTDLHEERAEAPKPIKRNLNTPSDPSKVKRVALHRSHDIRDNKGLPPLVFHQLHVNRAIRRLNRMTKRDVGPALDAEFETALRKRWSDAFGNDGNLTIKKRSGPRGGHAMSDSVFTGSLDTQSLKLGGGGQRHRHGNGKGAAAALGGGAAGAGAGAGVAAGEASGAGNNAADAADSSAADAATASSGADAASSADQANSAGFSQADLDALSQNTITPPGKTTAANSVPLSIEANDVAYFAAMEIGTPPQKFQILLDTGSADFWLPGEGCSTCGDHQALGATGSSSFTDTGKPFSVTYGTGQVEGTIIQDDVNIAGLILKNHTFGATSQESSDFGDDTVPFDGLMGLAQSTLSNQGVPTPIESLASAGLVAAAQMGFALGRVSDGNNIGEATFGGVDQTKFDGDLTLFDNVNTQGFWEGQVSDITVDGKSTGLTGRTAILDTGTTLIIAPTADAQAIHKAIPGASTDGTNFFVPCTTSAKVALEFGGTSFTIEPSDLAFQPVSNDLQGDCVSSISAGQIGGAKEWLVGDAFLKSFYLATDVDNNQIGLAVIKAA